MITTICSFCVVVDLFIYLCYYCVLLLELRIKTTRSVYEQFTIQLSTKTKNKLTISRLNEFRRLKHLIKNEQRITFDDLDNASVDLRGLNEYVEKQTSIWPDRLRAN